MKRKLLVSVLAGSMMLSPINVLASAPAPEAPPVFYVPENYSNYNPADPSTWSNSNTPSSSQYSNPYTGTSAGGAQNSSGSGSNKSGSNNPNGGFSGSSTGNGTIQNGQKLYNGTNGISGSVPANNAGLNGNNGTGNNGAAVPSSSVPNPNQLNQTQQGEWKLTLIKEEYKQGYIIRYYQGNDGRQYSKFIRLPIEVAKKVVGKPNPLLEAKKQLTAAYVVLNLPERLEHLEEKRHIDYPYVMLNATPQMKKKIEDDIRISREYAAEYAKKWLRMSPEERKKAYDTKQDILVDPTDIVENSPELDRREKALELYDKSLGVKPTPSEGFPLNQEMIRRDDELKKRKQQKQKLIDEFVNKETQQQIQSEGNSNSGQAPNQNQSQSASNQQTPPKAVNASAYDIKFDQSSETTTSNSSGFSWYWALLALPVAALLFFIWKKRKEREEDEYEDDDEYEEDDDE
ncbi:hypothetical protein [Aneurinibacillus tyrosinisolvens]|uniref:hypothetical protein n=1 Tax=Aneurinibacillus tyrosinisolvens TaxID=1443435 RepID=UPI00063F4F4E|nr:hypothetical protein [Aneurinibacillus tyrosinisolvens]